MNNNLYLTLGMRIIVYALSALWTINEASKVVDTSQSLDYGEINWKINQN